MNISRATYAILVANMLRPGLVLLVASCCLWCQTDRVRVWQDTVSFPTYKEDPPGPMPPFDQFALVGTGVHSIYPYTLRLNMTDDKRDTPWRVLHLENQYLHCMVLPDLGGHLYTCRDKLSGTDMFYANTAIKKADVAPRGAWVAGGIETSFPVAHSRVTVSPVNFATATNPDGGATIFVGTVDRVSGMDWRVAYTLRPGSAVLHQTTSIANPGPVRQPYQWWSNAAIRLPDEGLQFIYPMWVTAPHGAGVLEKWPVDSAGVDRSRSANYADDLGVFAYGSREPFFAEYNPQTRTGVAHWADPHEVPGKKIWAYGKSDKSYKSNLSDDHSGYAEIQSGLATTQDTMEYLEPQQARTFSEMWIPSRNIGGISRATPAAILYLQRAPQPGGTAKAVIELNVTGLQPHASVTVAKGDSILLQQTVDLDPATTFHVETAAVDAGGKFRVELKDASGQVLLAHQEDTYDAVTPAEVKLGQPFAPPPAKDPVGRADEDERVRVLDRAAAEYDEALRSKNPAAQKAAGRFCVELHRLTEAVAMLEPLHRTNPADAEVAYYLGVAKSELGDDAAARPLWEAIAQDAQFGSAAQDRLAALLARGADQQQAAGRWHVLAGRGVPRAAALEVALLRRLGQTAEAQAALQKARTTDPMDLLLRVESVWLGHEDAALWSQLAQDPEWVLNLADAYLDAGLYQDTVALLDHDYPAVGELEKEPGGVLPQEYPLIAYYRGYARSRLGQSSAEDFRKAAAQSTRFVYPNRASSYAVLQAAVKANPADATAHYLLGCLLFNSRDTDRAVAEWELAQSGAPQIPSYYETVVRALTTVKKDDRRAESLLKRGLAEHPNDPALTGLLASLRNGGATAATVPPQQVFGSPQDAAGYALAMLANRNLAGALAVFQARNFPEEKQPPDVRQAYAEVWLQNLLSAAHPGSCDDVEGRIENFVPEDKTLPFTFHGFNDVAKQLRIQFYFGLAESICGDKKGAERRWSRIAKSKAAATSADFPFIALAASLVDPAGSQRTVEMALEAVRGGAGPSEKGLRLYVEGILLRAAGRNDEATARFREGGAEPLFYTKYLNASALNDPPLPR